MDAPLFNIHPPIRPLLLFQYEHDLFTLTLEFTKNLRNGQALNRVELLDESLSKPSIKLPKIACTSPQLTL